jgi:hypothetical protein
MRQRLIQAWVMAAVSSSLTVGCRRGTTITVTVAEFTRVTLSPAGTLVHEDR